VAWKTFKNNNREIVCLQVSLDDFLNVLGFFWSGSPKSGFPKLAFPKKKHPE